VENTTMAITAGMPTMITPPAMARPRALATACPPASGWLVTSAVPAPSYRSTRDLTAAHHNSIARTDVVTLAQAGRGGFGVKQAAPPRGVPR